MSAWIIATTILIELGLYCLHLWLKGNRRCMKCKYRDHPPWVMCRDTRIVDGKHVKCQDSKDFFNFKRGNK